MKKEFGKDYLQNVLLRVDGNQGVVYKIQEDFVFIPRNKHDVVVTKNKDFLLNMIEKDKFPIEEPEWFPYAKERNRVLKFNSQFDHYFKYLKEHLNLSVSQLNEETLELFLSKVIGRSIKKIVEEKEIVSLTSILGEIMKRKYSGKWFAIKRYAIYNGYLVPNFLTDNKRVIPVADIIHSSLKWKTKNVNLIFKGPMFFNKDESNIGIDFGTFKQNNRVIKIE